MSMNKIKKIIYIVNNYLVARILGKPSTAQFWYLPERANIMNKNGLDAYFSNKKSPLFYFMNYSEKLRYNLKNSDGIIVLPYEQPIGNQVNPEAAFQYALALYDKFQASHDHSWLKQFLYYANYFLERQTNEGDWCYQFNWYQSKAPWSSALAQSRGASVMLRAWIVTGNRNYLESAKLAFSKFNKPCSDGGYLQQFSLQSCYYFEEYPNEPLGVINGFMASLFGIWEVNHWLQDAELTDLWELGICSLEKMLPYYTYNGWTLYDQSGNSYRPNINSPRYHSLMISYMQVLCNLTTSPVFVNYLQLWIKSNSFFFRTKALALKMLTKIKSGR